MTSSSAVPTVPTPTSRGPRGARAGAVGTAVSGCAALAHALAGGGTAAGAVAAVAVGATAVTWGLAGRRLTTAQLLGLLVLGQVALHVLAPAAPHDGAAMWVAHLGATAASLLLVRGGEDAWWRLADLVLPRVVVATSVPTTSVPRVTAPVLAPVSAGVPGDAWGRAPPLAGRSLVRSAPRP